MVSEQTHEKNVHFCWKFLKINTAATLRYQLICPQD